ncbi:hypothetical protein [Actinoallomurus soli]|uniref:hypothetical protein n=1 Tax=Actinoallomurus soli TaxID=2952535 RepID=UPI0020931949|nr:hypothetical protein [Actinoallomurus soli]MCO5967505.1 hypothetical protein [Actinoallomurus soli]
MGIESSDWPSVDVDEARRLFTLADSDETFESWLASQTKMAFYRSPQDELLVRSFQARNPWSKLFSSTGRLVGTLVATYWDVDWSEEHLGLVEDEANDEDDPEWRPAKIKISGIDGTFDGEIGLVYDFAGRGTYEAVRFTTEVAEAIASAFESLSDTQLNSVGEEDVISDRWNSEKYGNFIPRAHFSPGRFHVVTGDDEWESITPDEDGMYRLDFDGFYWGEVDPPKPRG